MVIKNEEFFSFLLPFADLQTILFNSITQGSIMRREFVFDTDVERVLEENGVSDEQIREMEYAIMNGLGSTISGTGGLKKIRCGARGRGKSGGVRIVFADYPGVGRTYLVAGLGKTERTNFTKQQRNKLKQFKRMLDRAVRS